MTVRKAINVANDAASYTNRTLSTAQTILALNGRKDALALVESEIGKRNIAESREDFFFQVFAK